jgi:hypothetical protein
MAGKPCDGWRDLRAQFFELSESSSCDDFADRARNRLADAGEPGQILLIADRFSPQKLPICQRS